VVDGERQHRPPRAAAGRTSELRPLTEAEAAEVDAHRVAMSGRRVDEFVPYRLIIVRDLDGEKVLDGYQHAADGDSTLCGVPPVDRFVMRHLFYEDSKSACPVCVGRMS
jgi:hypothetical protein